MLEQFAQQYGVQVFTQAGGPDTLQAVQQGFVPKLSYRLSEQDVTLTFLPTDFIQANAKLNRLMVNQVIAALAAQPGDRILELFCGLGNFTLPLGRMGAQLLGVEGNPALIERARHNADLNKLPQARFQQTDLYQNIDITSIDLGGVNKLLLDPPREGAMEILKAMPLEGVARIVYVSCDAKTLARDLAYLVNKRGYRLQSMRLVDMFPQTMHLETISLLTSKGP